MGLRSVLTAAALLGLLGGVFSAPVTTTAQSGSISRPAELRSGTCASAGEVVFGLANVVLTPGDLQGESGAVPVEQSGTVVPYNLSDLLATSHSIFVLNSMADATVVACGEIGGAINPDGTLGVGLRGVGLSGVAYFTPIAEVDSLLITILLVSDASADTTTVDAETALDEAAQEGSLTKELEVAESP